MPVINFENLKTEKPERNFDNVNLDENANIALQNSQGVYGVKKFFSAVKNAIDWISSIAGNKNFIGEVSMGGKKLATEEAVNNALAKYQSFFDTYTTDTKKRLKITISNEHFYISLLGDSNLRGLIDTSIGIDINASGSVKIANKGNISLTASLNRTTKELIVAGFTEWNNLRISGKNILNIEIIE